jgi:arylformamidase
MSYHFGRIEMVANTDTFIDAPYHLPAEAADVAESPREHLVDVLVVAIRASGHTAIGSKVLKRPGPAGGQGSAGPPGWSRHWRTPGYLTESPYLTRDFAEAMAQTNGAFARCGRAERRQH